MMHFLSLSLSLRYCSCCLLLDCAPLPALANTWSGVRAGVASLPVVSGVFTSVIAFVASSHACRPCCPNSSSCSSASCDCCSSACFPHTLCVLGCNSILCLVHPFRLAFLDASRFCLPGLLWWILLSCFCSCYTYLSHYSLSASPSFFLSSFLSCRMLHCTFDATTSTLYLSQHVYCFRRRFLTGKTDHCISLKLFHFLWCSLVSLHAVHLIVAIKIIVTIKALSIPSHPLLSVHRAKLVHTTTRPN